MRCVITPRANADLGKIAGHIAQDDPARALSFVQDLRERCARLCAMPNAWPVRPRLGAGVRMAVGGRYLIFYRVDGSRLLVLRVLHGSRDIERMF